MSNIPELREQNRMGRPKWSPPPSYNNSLALSVSLVYQMVVVVVVSSWPAFSIHAWWYDFMHNPAQAVLLARPVASECLHKPPSVVLASGRFAKKNSLCVHQVHSTLPLNTLQHQQQCHV